MLCLNCQSDDANRIFNRNSDSMLICIMPATDVLGELSNVIGENELLNKL